MGREFSTPQLSLSLSLSSSLSLSLSLSHHIPLQVGAYAGNVEAEQLRREKSFAMLRECAKLLRAHARNAYKLVAFNVLQNFYILVVVNVMRRIEDYLNAGGPDENPFRTMGGYGILLVIPYPFLHFFDYKKNYWGMNVNCSILQIRRRRMSEGT